MGTWKMFRLRKITPLFATNGSFSIEHLIAIPAVFRIGNTAGSGGGRCKFTMPESPGDVLEPVAVFETSLAFGEYWKKIQA